MTAHKKPVTGKIIIKNDEQRFVQEFLEYEPITLSDEDPVLTEYVQQAKEMFKGFPEEIEIKLTYKWI